MLILIEHISIICLVAMLFIAFSPYNMMLAVVWTISRTGEGVIQIYNQKRRGVSVVLLYRFMGVK